MSESSKNSTANSSSSVGAYATVIGYNLSVSVAFDGTFQLSTAPQVSAGITASASVPLVTANISSFSSFSNTLTFGPNHTNAQPSAWYGLGTPSGFPGASISMMSTVDGKQNQVQLGWGINDFIEAGASYSWSSNQNNSGNTTYNFSPNYRGNGFTDPRILDNSGGYRGLNTYSGVYASQAAENAAFEQDWNTATNAYSMQPSYTSFPTDPAAYNGYSDAFGDNSSSGSNSSGWHDFQYLGPADSGGSSGGGSSSGGSTDSGYNDSSYNYDNSYDYGSYDFGSSDWAPIVIDLDGDGVEIKPLDRSTTTFDIDSDGYKERTAWVGADDGMLVIDLNGDNQITQSKEMAFGEWTTEQDTDLQALAKVFDSNGDGTFDSRDARFNEFRIWKDANSNGVADEGEMMTLQAAGIAANDALYRKSA